MDGESLLRRARAIAARLKTCAPVGSRALLLFPTGPAFIEAFFGCLLAGVAAVPCPPPGLSGRDRHRHRVIAQNAELAVLMAGPDTRQSLTEELPGLPCFGPDQVLDCEGAAWRMRDLDSHTVAYLQYTSGSTSDPRGVVVTHAQLAANSRCIEAAWGYHAGSRAVMWVPNFHDDGLVHGIVQPVFSGSHCHLMSPLDFVRDPVGWLRLLSHLRATHAGGPNFAYELCLARLRPGDTEGLDLSALEVLYNAAEPVRLRTLERFHAALAPCGLRLSALLPTYGLAEATLLVSTGPRGQDPVSLRVSSAALECGCVRAATDGERAHVLVACGAPAPSVEVAIVHPDELRRCADDEVGEIWISGPSVASGYFRQEAASAAIFRAHIQGEDAPWLRTGDLGFMHRGQLVVSGRRKDLIIVSGANHYPQDVEWTAEVACPALRPGNIAAFAMAESVGESVVLAAELAPTWKGPVEAVTFALAIDEALSRDHGLRLSALLLLAPGTLPKTSSGKVQRGRCRTSWLAGELSVVASWSRPAATGPLPRGAVRELLAERVAQLIGIPPSDLDRTRPFAQYGLGSRDMTALAARLEQALGCSLSPLDVFAHPTVDALASFLSEGAPATPPQRSRNTDVAEPIAIVGMACRFPGADDPASFWRLIAGGVDAVGPVPDERWPLWEEYHPQIRTFDRLAVRQGGFLRGVDLFDAAFFGISPREAERMDPQQRLLLELSWEALEDAGLPPDQLAGSDTGVYVGVLDNEYARRQLAVAEIIDAYTGTGGSTSILANRISYTFDLHGPSLICDTACSSSLIAAHLAVRSLRSGETGLAIVAGVNLMLTPAITINFSQAGALSPDGRCRPFDAGANGFVRSEGAGVLVLKRLSDAIADGDRVHAVIRGTATWQDGRTNGIMAPSQAAQEAVLRLALHDAGAHPEEISYVEAHGTGTPLGDPIEAHALGAVLGARRDPQQRLWLGSAKSHLGHLEAAAGIAGLMKAVLSLKAEELHPILHFHSPNPRIPLDELGLAVPRNRVAWTGPHRLCGVSSFGFGGTNAHAVLECAPAPAARPETPASFLLPLSARSPLALVAQARRVAACLRTRPSEMADLCYTAAVRRAHLPFRLAVSGENPLALATALEAAQPSGPTEPRELCWLAAGHGGQWMGMATAISHPAFVATLSRAEAAVQAVLGRSPLAEPAPDDVAWAQPAIYTLQLAQGWFLAALALAPEVIVGHSLGEAAAAVLAGVLTPEEGARIVVLRSRLMARVQGQGAVLAVALSAEELAARLAGRSGLCLAIDSGPKSSAAAGDADAIAELANTLTAEGVACRRVHTAVAFHSPHMDALCAELREGLADLRPRSADRALYSTVTGDRVDGIELTADHWVKNLRAPARLRQALAAALGRLRRPTVVELGPHPTLRRPVQESLANRGSSIVDLSRREAPDAWRSALAELYTAGCAVRWAALYPEGGRVVDLPRYPWQRERYWLAIPDHRGRAVHPLLKRTRALSPGEERSIVLDLFELHWLVDHRFRGRVVLPGAALLELARAGAAEALGPAPLSLEGVRFLRPLFRPETGPWELRLQLRGEAGGAAWSVWADGHCAAEGGVRAAPSAPLPPLLSEIRSRTTPADPAALSASLAARGLEYGPAFAVVSELRLGQDEALATLRLVADSESGSWGVHPAILDGGFQALGALVEDDGRAFLPAGVERLVLYAAVTGGALAHVRRIPAADGAFRADIRLLREDGTLLSVIDGLELRAVAGQRALDRYRLAWEPAKAVSGLRRPGPWQVLGQGPFVDALLSQLRAAGALVELGAPAAGRAPAGVVDLRPTAVTNYQEAVAAAVAVLDLMRSIDGSDARLYVVTSGVAQAREEGVFQAVLHGLCRTLRLENPAKRCTIIDCEVSDAYALAAELLADDVEDEVALHAGRRAVLRLRPAAPAAPRQVASPVLITGGFGGLGFTLARALAAEGADELVLLSRSPPPEGAVRELEALGARVWTLHADVGDAAALAAAVASLPQKPRTVLHAAGVLDDGVALALDAARLDRVLWPKLGGAWNLHQLGLKLDAFVLCSSAAGVLGAPGQANYAAANAALDALAHARRALGLPAVAVAWGPWSEVGMAARAGQLERMAAEGMGAISPERGAALLKELLNPPDSMVAVLPLDLSRLRRSRYGTRPVLAGLWPEPGRAAKEDAPAELTPADTIAAIVAAAFHLDPTRLDRDMPLRQLGLDSMMALEIRGRVRQRFSVDLPPAELLSGPSVNTLATRIAALQTPDVANMSDDEVEVLLRKMLSAERVEADLSGEPKPQSNSRLR